MATFHFEVKELGHRLSDAELDELKRSRYGDVRGRQANLAETPAQLLLEAVSAKQTPTNKATSNAQQNEISVKISVDLGNPATNQTIQKVPEAQQEEAKKTGASADGLNKIPSGRLSSPVKQREYRRPDGRKRIIPEAVGVTSNQEALSSGPQSQLVDFSSLALEQQKDDRMLIGTNMVAQEIESEAKFQNDFLAQLYGVMDNETTETSTSGCGSRYEAAAVRALRKLWSMRSSLNLLGTTLDVVSGEWIEYSSGIGAGVSSMVIFRQKETQKHI